DADQQGAAGGVGELGQHVLAGLGGAQDVLGRRGLHAHAVDRQRVGDEQGGDQSEQGDREDQPRADDEGGGEQTAQSAAAGVSGGHGSSSTSCPGAGVDHAVEQVHDQVGREHRDGDDQEQALHQRIVVVVDGLE